MVPGKSIVLVTAQLACILYIAATGLWWPASLALRLCILIGLGVGLWAILSIPFRHLRIRPEPHPEGALCRKGPYRWIRHPMYTAVILVIGPLVVAQPGGDRIGIGIALLVVLIIKIRVEEHMLKDTYPVYAEYKQTAGAVFPRILRK